VRYFSIVFHEDLLKFVHPKASLYLAIFEVLTVMLLRSQVYYSAQMGLLASEGEGTTVL
jgi:hypothetical protein